MVWYGSSRGRAVVSVAHLFAPFVSRSFLIDGRCVAVAKEFVPSAGFAGFFFVALSCLR